MAEVAAGATGASVTAVGAVGDVAGGVGTNAGATLAAIISDAFLATRIPINVVIDPVINRTMSFNIFV